LLIQENLHLELIVFKDEVMDKKNYATNILNLPATGAIVQAVGKLKALLVISDWHMKLKK
jgi:hypothetical protein